MRRTVRWLTYVGVALLAVVVLPGTGRVAPARAAAPIAYPDLQLQVPTTDVSIGHPTATRA